MTWAKLDDRANEHEKQIAAGADACWLWACGLMYCNRQQKKTGRIPKTVVHAGMLFPRLGEKEAKKLVAVGLWHDDGDAYLVHEYHGWNPELREKRAEAGRKGGQRSGEARREAKPEATPEANGEANAKQVASDEGSKNEAPDEARAQPRAYARTDARGIHPTPPHSEEEIPQPPAGGGRKLRDPFASSRDREDVQRLFEAWKEAFGFRGAKLGIGAWNSDADTLAEAIDAYGIGRCLLVLRHAPADGMVSGRQDDRKAKHESIAYIFGNATAFARILRAAEQAEQQRQTGSVSDLVSRLKQRKVEAS